MIKGFREFVLRGNADDLAVGIVIGAAFTALVNAFVVNFINPILGLFGTKNLNAYIWCLKAPDGKTACAMEAARQLAAFGLNDVTSRFPQSGDVSLRRLVPVHIHVH